MLYMNFISFLTNLPIYVFWFVIVMIPLVTIHEFGHFIMAKIFKVRVPEFGIGVPPRVMGKRWKGMTWSLNWIPLGAFVRISGDNDTYERAYRNIQNGEANEAQFVEERVEEILSLGDLHEILERNNVDSTKEWEYFAKHWNKKDYASTPEAIEYKSRLNKLVEMEYDAFFNSKNKTLLNSLFFTKALVPKILILVGGVTMNIIGAFLLLLIALNTTGLLARNTFDKGSIDYGYLTENKTFDKEGGNDSRQLIIPSNSTAKTPAEIAGIVNNSELVSINDIPAKNWTNAKLAEQIKSNPNVEVKVNFKTEGNVVSRIITPAEINGRKIVGILLTNTLNYKSVNFVTSIKDAFDHTWYYTKLTFNLTMTFFQDLFTPGKTQQALDQTSGPVAISYVSKNLFDSFGASAILWLMALISISLAVFNMLPIPALDGGRIVLVILESIFGAKVKKFEPILVSTTYIALLIFMFLILGKDVWTIWKIQR